jgi:hypothetical protein
MLIFMPYIRKYRWLLVIAIVGILCVVGAITFWLSWRQLPGAIWLPTNLKQTNDRWEILQLPTESKTTDTSYGKALTFTSTDGWQTIMEFKPNARLVAAKCPNIAQLETLVPSDCEKIGTFHGQDVYAMNRSLPSGTTEYFTQANGTFIYLKSGGDGGRSLDYLHSFTRISRFSMHSHIKTNRERANTIQAQLDTAKAKQ